MTWSVNRKEYEARSARGGWAVTASDCPEDVVTCSSPSWSPRFSLSASVSPSPASRFRWVDDLFLDLCPIDAVPNLSAQYNRATIVTIILDLLQM